MRRSQSIDAPGHCGASRRRRPLVSTATSRPDCRHAGADTGWLSRPDGSCFLGKSMHMTDTIYALSSGAVPSGVAVIRISGPAAGGAVLALALPLPEPRQAALRMIRRPGGEVIDQGLVLWFPGPRSETGEDMAELQLHGGRAVVQAVFDALAE